jgi:hypothetical protein
MYKRSKIYPSGARIPESLPDSYQPAAYGNAPEGQSCFTCQSFDMANRKCSKWDAPVKPRWWCEAWTGDVISIKPVLAAQPQPVPKPALTKKITTSTVEEHFSEMPMSQFRSGLDNWYDTGITVPEPEPENEEDVIRVNIPLMIRLLEYARESTKGDIDLHMMVERMIDLGEEGEVLEMDNYAEIVPNEENGTAD